MRHFAIYELYQAAFRSLTAEDDPSYEPIHNFILDISHKDLDLGDLDIKDLPTNIRRGTVRRFIDLVKDKIILINGEFPKSQSLGLHYYECHKLLILAEILNTLLYKRAALSVAEYVLVKSEKFFFLNITFQAYRIIYAMKTRMNDEAGEINAAAKFKKYLKFYEIEKSIEIEYNEILRVVKKTNTYNAHVIKACQNAIDEYKIYEGAIPSFYFHFFYYTILNLKYTNEKKHDEGFLLSEKALSYFESLDFNYIPGKLAFIYCQIVYSIQKKDFDTGVRLIKKAQTYVSKKSLHWFRIKENEIFLYFHSGDHTKAALIFLEATANKYFVSLSSYDRQRWFLYEAYVNLVIETKNANVEERKKRFSVQKFINELPQFSKDKRSMNIPILIAQMLFFIVRKQYNNAIDRIESLDKYSSRYLRNDETFRSNCFIKMLLEIPKNSFNRLRVERAAEKYFRRLLDSEIDLIDQPFEIEIIPYERLWAMIMNYLRPDHHYTPKTPRTPQLT